MSNKTSFTPKKYWPLYTIEKAEDKLIQYNFDAYKYFKNKIRIIEHTFGEEEIDLSLLQWIVIYQDKVGKVEFNAKMINYSTFSVKMDSYIIINSLNIWIHFKQELVF